MYLNNTNFPLQDDSRVPRTSATGIHVAIAASCFDSILLKTEVDHPVYEINIDSNSRRRSLTQISGTIVTLYIRLLHLQFYLID